MEPTNRHPLDCITNQSGLSMLECLIPFVDFPLKLPLALFIKFNEIRMIMNAFHSFDSISGLGLNATSKSPTDMLCALTGISPEMMNLLMSMASGENGGLSPDFLSGLSGFGQSFSDISGMNTKQNGNSNQHNYSANPLHSFTGKTGLSENIANIFAEYDMEQAEAYTQEQPFDYNLQTDEVNNKIQT